MRSTRFLTACFVILAFALPSKISLAQKNKAPFSLENLVRLMETRRGNWIGFKAAVTLRSLSAENRQASCEGSLVYHRLDEKILLQCFNSEAQRLFAFKADDRDFELYLPEQKTIFRGNIFDLEDSPEIDSHLRAQDLYRALKPMAVPSENIEVEVKTNGVCLLKIFRITPRGRELARKLQVTREGDVSMELYYHPSGRPSVSIHRSNFQGLDRSGEISKEKTDFVFPFHLLIKSNSIHSKGRVLAETTLDFKNIRFFQDLTEEEFRYPREEGIRVIEIDELKKPAAPAGSRSE